MGRAYLRVGVVVCLGLGAGCDPEESPPAPSIGGVTVLEVRATGGLAPSLSLCDPDCGPLAPGEHATHGTIRVGAASIAVLDLGSDATATLAPGSEALLEGDHPIQLVSGALTFEAPRASAASFRVGSRRIAVDPERPLRMVVSSDGDDATLTIHRGLALVEADDGSERLLRGQSMTFALDDAEDAARPSYRSTRGELAPQRTRDGGEPTVTDPPAVDVPKSPRGLGRMTARVPGREEVTEGVHLASHVASVVIQGGVATTTVEEVFENQSDRVLEGKLVFPVPSDATVSRLALWVGNDLVEGEMVERKRAASIFKNIVDDTVRPRDPALLEWSQGSELSLKIFPIPARGSRKVLFAYEQPLEDGAGRGRYVYPLSSGSARDTRVGKLSFNVRIEGADAFDVRTPGYDASVVHERSGATIALDQEDTAPDRDFVVTFKRPSEGGASMLRSSSGAFIVRAPLDPPADAALPAPVHGDRVVVVDASASQTRESFAAEIALVRATLDAMEDGERFAVLACDSACMAYPEDGVTAASPRMVAAAIEWLAAHEPSGSSDVAGALSEGLRRLEHGGQLVYLGDGMASSGELTERGIVARALRYAPPSVDLRFIGVGRTVDDLGLSGIARALGATYERHDLSSNDVDGTTELVLSLSRPVVRDLSVELPGGARLVGLAPSAARLGDELRLAGVGATTDGGSLTLRGTLAGVPFEKRLAITARPAGEGFAERAVARARIDLLTRTGDPANDPEIVDLSRRFFVMSRKTSLLVLENDQMFAAFGIERTRGDASEKGPAPAARAEPTTVARPSEFGMLGMLGGRDSQLPPEPLGARGSMWGSEIGESLGHGGLGLSGIGEGGGGKGEAIGLGSVGTIGRGSSISVPFNLSPADGASGTGSGFGSGAGRLGGSHRESPPAVRMGAATVSGRLPPEVIQRIVRQSFGRMRLCYEQGLRTNPNLEGRVSVSFRIGGDGRVTSANGSGSLPDQAVVSCVARAFFALSFPQPEGGGVSVVYPISFSPSGGQVGPRSSSSWGMFGALPRPIPSHQTGDDGWTRDAESKLDGARAALAADPMKRSLHGALIRALLARGRFAEAKQAAERFVALDPDLPLSRDLLAQALVAAGELDRAVRSVDEIAELSRDSLVAHRRAAIAFESVGDERRACAHFRSIASLDAGNRAAIEQAQRCRARVLGEQGDVRRELREAGVADDRADKDVESWVSTRFLPTGPAFESLGVTLTCAGDGGCPSFATIDVAGTVVSPLVPDASARAYRIVKEGTYRTILVGGDPAKKVKLTVSVRGATRSVELTRAERVTALTTHVP